MYHHSFYLRVPELISPVRGGRISPEEIYIFNVSLKSLLSLLVLRCYLHQSFCWKRILFFIPLGRPHMGTKHVCLSRYSTRAFQTCETCCLPCGVMPLPTCGVICRAKSTDKMPSRVIFAQIMLWSEPICCAGGLPWDTFMLCYGHIDNTDIKTLLKNYMQMKLSSTREILHWRSVVHITPIGLLVMS